MIVKTVEVETFIIYCIKTVRDNRGKKGNYDLNLLLSEL